MLKIIYRGNSSGNLGIHPTYHFCHFLGIQPWFPTSRMETGPFTMITVFHAVFEIVTGTTNRFTVPDNFFITFPILCTDTIIVIIECKFGRETLKSGKGSSMTKTSFILDG